MGKGTRLRLGALRKMYLIKRGIKELKLGLRGIKKLLKLKSMKMKWDRLIIEKLNLLLNKKPKNTKN